MSAPRASVLVFAVLLLAACRSSDPYTYYEDTLNDSLEEDTKEARTKHSELLEKVLTYSDEQKRTPPPGVCAELAYYYAREGDMSKVEELLAREKQYYPESEKFVSAVRLLLMNPEGRILE